MADSLDFDSLVACYYGPLYQFAFSLTRDEADACDLVQETFCIWANKGHQLRDPSKVKTWLFTTLHREFLGARRKETRFPHVDLEFAAGELPVVSPATANRLDTVQVLTALSGWMKFIRRPSPCFICRIALTMKSRPSFACRWAPSSRAWLAAWGGCTNFDGQ